MNASSILLALLLVPNGMPQQWLLHLIGYWPDKFRLLVILLLTIVMRARTTSFLPMAAFKNPIMIACLAFFTCGLLSLMWSPNPAIWYSTFTERGTRVFIPMLVFAAATRRPKDLWLPLLGFVAVSIFTCCLSIYGGSLVGFSRPAASDSNGLWIFPRSAGIKNALGQSCASLSVIAFAFTLASTRLRSKVVWLGLTLFGAAATVVAGAKSNLLGAVVGCFLMVLFQGVGIRAMLIYIVLAALGLGTAMKLMPEEFVESSTSIEGGSVSARPFFWGLAIDHIKKKPFEPIGWGTPMTPPGMRAVDVWNYCNVFLEDYIEGGAWAALVEFGWFMLCLWVGYKNAQRLPAKSIAAAANNAAIGLIVINMAFGLVDSYWTRVTQMVPTFASMGILIYLRMWIEQRDKAALKKLDANLEDGI